MDYEAESARAQLDQFKRDRWPYAIGHVGATAALVGIAWPVADHSSLLWFAVVHHLANWFLAITLYFPLRSKGVKRLPLWTFIGVVIVNATLSSALLFDLTAAPVRWSSRFVRDARSTLDRFASCPDKPVASLCNHSILFGAHCCGPGHDVLLLQCRCCRCVEAFEWTKRTYFFADQRCSTCRTR